MDFLKRNATKFLRLAEEMLQKGDYSMAMLFTEQFFQLSLKVSPLQKVRGFSKDP